MDVPVPDWGDDGLVMISALQHFSYCPRQCGLIHLDQAWDENLYTLRGRRVHELVDQPGGEGPTSGNVLLRRAQHEALGEPARTLAVCRAVVAGKIQNTRQVLLRGARESASSEEAERLGAVARHLADVLPRLAEAPDPDTVRGLEGDVARRYFEVFTLLVREGRDLFALNGRTRRLWVETRPTGGGLPWTAVAAGRRAGCGLKHARPRRGA